MQENKDNLLELRKKINKLNEKETKLRNLYLKKIANGEVFGPATGWPSIDRPSLKYYSDTQITNELPKMTVFEYLKKCNENNEDSIAISSKDGVYTYKELYEVIENAGKSLYSLGVNQDRKVMMMLPPTSYESILFYATDVVGSAITETPIQNTIDEVMKKLNKFDIKVFFIDSSLLNKEIEEKIYQNTNVDTIVYTGYYEKNDSKTISWNEFLKIGIDKKIPDIKRNPDDLFFIASTGGSTGEPKSVMLSDNNFNMAVHQYLNSDLKYNAKDTWLRLWSLFSASAAVSNNHLPLCAGMQMIIRDFPLNINDFDKMIIEEQPEHLILIPQLLDVLDKSELLKNKDLSNIKTAGCGGLGITAQFEENVNKFFKEHNINAFLGYGWGCTESYTLGSIRSNFETAKIGSTGATHVDTIVSAFDPETLEEKSYGEEGELCIKNVKQMLGYYEDEEMTNDVLKKHEDGSIWLHTKDLGTVSSDGLVTVKGRMTRTIFVFPTAKIYPSELENMIAKIPGVDDVLIGEMPDKEHEGFGMPVAFIIPEEGLTNEEVNNNVMNICNSYLPEYAIPKNIYFLNEFPVTKVGKKDVRTLEKKYTR